MASAMKGIDENNEQYGGMGKNHRRTID